jgi:hypothetical protein
MWERFVSHVIYTEMCGKIRAMQSYLITNVQIANRLDIMYQ